MVGVWWFWWEGWYLSLLYMDTSSILPLFYLNSSSTLYILGFLVADISPSWAMADGYSSAGWTGLGSAVLAGFVIGLGITGG